MNLMTLAGFHRSRPNQGYKLACLLMLVLMQLALLQAAPAPAEQSAEPKAHPLLLELAATAPQKQVSILVRTDEGASGVEAFVVRLGGSITHQFPMINGFAASVPARLIPQLAALDGLAWISPDAEMADNVCSSCATINASQISNWSKAIELDLLRSWYPDLQGQGVTVAVLDSGVMMSDDLKDSSGNSRLIAQVNKAVSVSSVTDGFGHGTHVAGLIAGDGRLSGGQVTGVAPRAKIINVRVNDGNGMANGSDVIAGLQWIYDNRTTYNIKVVNISLNSNVAESQHVAALNSAVEILWFAGITVVVSAGNNGNGTTSVPLYPPANDPFVITVGAVDDKGTPTRSDDSIASFSARGTIPTNTNANYAKPEIVAPGVNILSLKCNGCYLANTYPGNVASGFTGASSYFKASGTSMSAAIVSGMVALIYQRTPGVTPDIIKWRLIEQSEMTFGDRPRYVKASWSVTADHQISANTSIRAADPLWTGVDPINWGSTHNWDSARWGSARWGSARWGSMNMVYTSRNSIYLGR